MAENARKIEEMSEVEEPGQTPEKTGSEKTKPVQPEPNRPVQLLYPLPLHTLSLCSLHPRVCFFFDPRQSNPEPSQPHRLAISSLSLPRHLSLSYPFPKPPSPQISQNPKTRSLETPTHCFASDLRNHLHPTHPPPVNHAPNASKAPR